MNLQFPLSFDCAWPLKGKYLTLQRYGYLPEFDDQAMEPSEIDITVFCGPFKSKDDDLCLSTETPIDHCAMTAMAAGKSELPFPQLLKTCIRLYMFFRPA